MKKEMPEMRPMPAENELIKSILETSDVDAAKGFLDMWDEPMTENGETFGDIMANALDYAMDIITEKSIIINNEKYPLVEDGKFNMFVMHNLFGKQLILRAKPKNVSKFQYLAAPDVYCTLVEDECNETTIVFKPSLVGAFQTSEEAKEIIGDETLFNFIEECENVTMTLDDMDDNDIILFIYNEENAS